MRGETFDYMITVENFTTASKNTTLEKIFIELTTQK
jgi:hypothetical protein